MELQSVWPCFAGVMQNTLEMQAPGKEDFCQCRTKFIKKKILCILCKEYIFYQLYVVSGKGVHGRVSQVL